jgi:hypothetical protein
MKKWFFYMHFREGWGPSMGIDLCMQMGEVCWIAG